MSNGPKIFAIIMLFAIGSVVFITFSVVERVKSERKMLLENGFVVIDGIIDSPSVIIKVNRQQFYNKLYAIDMNTVYYFQYSFYVFEENMQIAYRYSP